MVPFLHLQVINWVVQLGALGGSNHAVLAMYLASLLGLFICKTLLAYELQDMVHT